MYRHLLLPTDGSALSSHAVDQGLALAASLGAKATIMTVVEPFHSFNVSPDLLVDVREDYEKSAREDAERVLQAATDKAQSLGVEAVTALIRDDQPHQQIIDAAAERGCDLIVMASHGRRGVSALIMGSVTQKVLTHSTTPVLVIRGGG